MNYPWQATVQDELGNIIVNPVVTVWEADGVTLATIYDVTGAGIANPITGSLEGFVQFWAAEGEYRIEGASGGEETEVWSWIAGPVGTVSYNPQSLSPTQKLQARENLGLGNASTVDIVPISMGGTGVADEDGIRAALKIVGIHPFGSGFYVEYKTSDGQVWRDYRGSTVKSASSTPDVSVPYGITFLTNSQPIVSNGDASAISAIIMAHGATSTGFIATARNATDGSSYLGAYRVNWSVIGRIS